MALLCFHLTALSLEGNSAARHTDFDSLWFNLYFYCLSFLSYHIQRAEYRTYIATRRFSSPSNQRAQSPQNHLTIQGLTFATYCMTSDHFLKEFSNKLWKKSKDMAWLHWENSSELQVKLASEFHIKTTLLKTRFSPWCLFFKNK